MIRVGRARRLAWSSVAVMIAVAACGWRSDGVRIDLAASTALPAPARADAAGLHWTAQDGTLVTVTRGWVTVSSIEIFPCPPSALRKVWNELGYGTARAHTTSNPTRLGAPTVVSALQEAGTAVPLGALRPPAVRFCRMRVTFEPADEDAASLPAEVDMVGKTLWLDGTRTPPSGTAQPFHLEASGIGTVELDIDPVELGEANLEASAVVELHPARWLDGVDLGSGAPGPAALDAVAASTIFR